MKNMNPLPPQAYTKDTLLNAYAWLQNQTDTIKEMAKTPDILVSLYLKATRDGNEALDRPSIHNFKNELKHLASMMGELDKPQVHARPQFINNPPPPPSQTQNTPIMNQNHSAAAPTINVANTFIGLDDKSLAMIHEVKEDFNLSNDFEALRMLIKVGYTRSQSLLK